MLINRTKYFKPDKSDNDFSLNMKYHVKDCNKKLISIKREYIT